MLVQSTPRGALGTTSSAATVNRIGSSDILYDLNAQGFFKRESQGIQPPRALRLKGPTLFEPRIVTEVRIYTLVPQPALFFA